MRITEGDADLRGRKTLTGELGDVLDDILGSSLEPGRGSAAVGESGGRCTQRLETLPSICV